MSAWFHRVNSVAHAKLARVLYKHPNFNSTGILYLENLFVYYYEPLENQD